jgi:hypothetical protein
MRAAAMAPSSQPGSAFTAIDVSPINSKNHGAQRPRASLTAGPAKIAAMRAAGYDPSTTLEAQRRRAATASQQRKAVVAWRDDGSLDGVDFQRDILPKMQGLPVRAIAEAMGTGISQSRAPICCIKESTRLEHTVGQGQ